MEREEIAALLVAFYRGATRAVLCLGALAFKFPRSLDGARHNRHEAHLYLRSDENRRALLCPPLWCFPLGVVLVMRRASSMSDAEFRKYVRDAGLIESWGCKGPGDDPASLFERKREDWGWLDGKPVAVDYANF